MITPTTVNAAEDALDELFYTDNERVCCSYREDTDVREQVLAIRALIAECRAAGAVLDQTETEKAHEQAQNKRLENGG